MKKRQVKGSSADANRIASNDTKRLQEFPALVEHCCCTRYDDGEVRTPGWFTVKTTGAAWIVQVKDPDSAMSFQSIGDTLDKAMETAELLLGCDDAPWEPDPWLSQRKGRKKAS